MTQACRPFKLVLIFESDLHKNTLCAFKTVAALFLICSDQSTCITISFCMLKRPWKAIKTCISTQSEHPRAQLDEGDIVKCSVFHSKTVLSGSAGRRVKS